MRNLRNRYNYKQRLEFHTTAISLRQYLIPLLKKRQNNVRNDCKKPAKAYDVDHKVYNPMVTLNELQLLCIPCHVAKTDFRGLTYA